MAPLKIHPVLFCWDPLRAPKSQRKGGDPTVNWIGCTATTKATTSVGNRRRTKAGMDAISCPGFNACSNPSLVGKVCEEYRPGPPVEAPRPPRTSASHKTWWHGDFPVRYVSLPEFIKGFFLGSTSNPVKGWKKPPVLSSRAWPFFSFGDFPALAIFRYMFTPIAYIYIYIHIHIPIGSMYGIYMLTFGKYWW